MLDLRQISRCYQAWICSVIPQWEGDIIAIDGKTVCGSGTKGKGIKSIHMVSTWSVQAGVTLAQSKTMDKGNEITAIPDILDMLSVSGGVITIDAIGCQSKIAEKIIERKADYIFACMGNQPLLHQEIIEYFEFAEECGYLEI